MSVSAGVEQSLSSRMVDRCFVLLSIVAGIDLTVLSWHKPLWTDEFFSLYTAKASSLSALLNVQKTAPVALDPPLYHLLSHYALAIPGLNEAFAVRLPAIIAMLIALLYFYRFLRELLAAPLALMACCVLLPSTAITYGFEARPYAVVLASTAAALFYYRRLHDPSSQRMSSAFCFAFALAIGLQAHYMAVLVLVPFGLAEVDQLRRRRKIDLFSSGSLIAAAGTALLWLPFLHAAKQYKATYYGNARPTKAAEAYAWLVSTGVISRLRDAFENLQSRWAPLLLGLIIAALLVMFLLAFRNSLRKAYDAMPRETVLLLSLAALPVFGAIFGAVTAGSFEYRYTISFALGVFAFLAVLYAADGRVPTQSLVLVILVGCLLARGVRFYTTYADETHEMSRIKKIALAVPAGTAIADLHEFLPFAYYGQALGRTDLIYVYDRKAELETVRSDTNSLSAKNLTSITPFRFTTLQEFRDHPTPIFERGTNREWLLAYLRKSNVEVVPIMKTDGFAVWSVPQIGELTR